jgi:hypothetical protein
VSPSAVKRYNDSLDLLISMSPIQMQVVTPYY